ncbi:G domain-containing protein [Salix suchowensis]|nr:G domain-containing protein [Salix suchowensis]
MSASSFREGAVFPELTLHLRATFTKVNDGYEVRLLALSKAVVTDNKSGWYVLQKTIRPPEVQLDGLPRTPVLKHATDVKGHGHGLRGCLTRLQSRDPSSGSSTSGSPTTSDSHLPSTIDDITRVCPRFRVLVIGKVRSYVGVSLSVTETSVRLASVAGCSKSVTKTSLTSTWATVSPCFGSNTKHNLHSLLVPVVVVFTKFDKLVTMKRMRLPLTRTAGLSSDEVLQLARGNALQAFEKLCIEPLKTVVAGKEMPAYIRASTSQGYEETLAELVDRTYTDVRKYVAEEASLVGAIAQRTSSETKIYASIADVIAVWNFQDPNKARPHSLILLNNSNWLYGCVALEFHQVSGADVADCGRPGRTGHAGPKQDTGWRDNTSWHHRRIIGGLSGPAAPIVIPIVATVVFAKWVYDVYKQSAPVLRCLMGYIVDLTIIMQILFMLTRGDPRPVSNRMIKLATKTYAESPAKVQIHNQIQDYVERNDVFKRMHRDGVLAKIVDLIEKWKIEEGEGIGLRLGQSQLDSLGLFEDEAW